MPIISVRDNENNEKMKKKRKKKKNRKKQGGTEVIVKGWELNNFAVHLN